MRVHLVALAIPLLLAMMPAEAVPLPVPEPKPAHGFGCGVNGPIITSGSCTLGCDSAFGQFITVEVSGLVANGEARCGGQVARCTIPLGGTSCKGRSPGRVTFHDHNGRCTISGPVGFVGVCNPEG